MTGRPRNPGTHAWRNARERLAEIVVEMEALTAETDKINVFMLLCEHFDPEAQAAKEHPGANSDTAQLPQDATDHTARLRQKVADMQAEIDVPVVFPPAVETYLGEPEPPRDPPMDMPDVPAILKRRNKGAEDA